MASYPSNVQPGDLITSEFFNALLSDIAALRDAIDDLQAPVPGGVIVSGVFGRTLSEARTMITDPSRQLAMGTVLDAGGTVHDPASTAVRLARVLNQVPAGGARVAAGTSVNLVIAATTGGGTPTPSPTPTITRLLNGGGVVTARFPVGTAMIIEGTNFDSSSANNAVTFNGQSSPTVPSTDDPTRRIHVVVPTGIAGAPTADGQPDLTGVTVRVRNVVTGREATATCTIAPPPAVAPPHISDIPAGPHLTGSNVAITGTGFSTTASQNVVSFAGIPAAVPSEASTTRLVVRVPSGIPG